MSLWRHASFDLVTDSTLGFSLFGGFGSPAIGTPGRTSPHCVSFRNTGFGSQILQWPLPATSGYAFGFAYRPVVALGRVNDIFYLQNVNGTIVTRMLTIKTRLDNKLDVLTGPLLNTFTTTASFALNDWHYIEVQYDVGGDVKIYVDDVLDTDTNVTTDPSKSPDFVSYAWSNLGSQGWDWDDVYVAAGTDAASLERLGPIRITSFWCRADIVTGFGRVGAGSNAGCISDRNGVTSTAPDGDSTFVQAAFPTKDLYYLAPQNDCKGRIIAVGINVVAKAPSGGTPTLEVLCRGNLTIASETPIGTARPLTSDYALTIAYRPLSVNTNAFWTDGEIESCGWGIQSGGSGAARCTMFWVDKIQSLRSVPFNCGQLGNYTIMKH